MMLLVENIPGTSNLKPSTGYNSWKEFYKKSKTWPTYCSVYYCYERAEDTAHVRDKNGNWYLVPVCKEHNHKEGWFYVEEDRLLKIRALW